MKKSITKKMSMLLVCILAAGMILTGCGDSDDGGSNASNSNNSSDNNNQTSQDDNNQGSDEKPVDSYTFTYNGTTVSMNADMSTITSSLGEPAKYFESQSCAFQGLDKVYTYGSVVIQTYPKDDKDYVYSIQLKDDTVETKEGVYIGSSKDDVKKAYGTPSTENENAYIYTKGDCTLTFIFTNDAVAEITYVAITG